MNGLKAPLSTAQVGMWFNHQRDPTGRIGTLAERIDIHGPVDPALLRRAWQQVGAETDASRVSFAEVDGTLTQVIAPPAGPDLPIIDLARSAAEDWIRERLSRPMELSGSTSECALLKVADDHFVWFHRYHHIAIDYYGSVLVTQRLAEVYTALAAGLPLPANPARRLSEVLAEDEAYQRSPEHSADRRHWLDSLGGRPAAAELYGRVAPPGENVRRTTFLSDPLLDGLRAVATRSGTTWSRVLVAAAAAYLSRMTGERDVLLGLPVANRTTPAALVTPSLQANVVPLRLSVRWSMSFAELAAQAAEAVAGALAHQRYRYEDLRRDLAIEAGRPLLGWTVNVMSFERELRFAGHPATRHNLANGPVEDFSIFALSRSDGRGVQVDFVANPSRYGDPDVEAHQQGFLSLLTAMAAEPDRPLAGLTPSPAPLMTAGPATPAKTFPELFEASVRATPEATAVVAEAETLTYRELNARANRLAHHLIGRGIGPGDVVALHCGRRAEDVVALVAILKAGAAYLPIDAAYPAERVALLLREARPKATLESSPAVDGPDFDPTDADRVAPLVPSCPAYVIYTSGSTGTPNGVVATHTGLAGLATAQIERFAVRPGRRVLQFASPGFDGAVAEVVTTLAAGAALVIAPAERLVPGAALTALIKEAGVTHLTLPPTVLAAVPENGLPGLETLVVAGEPCPPDIVTRWAGRLRMINAYGPTEATVCATMSEQLDPDGGPPAIGRPVAGTGAYVLDSVLSPVPVGAVGQLYLTGAGLARGYQGRPALTAERFVADPFGPPGTRMYRTGDLVRWRGDGSLEFVARADAQLALRGFRIEPGEIEAVLTRHPAVAQAAVSVGPGHQLIAYVVPRAAQTIEPAAVRRFAAARLPGHLVPSTCVSLDRLPLTPNGKLDRPALARRTAARTTGRRPETPLEKLVCAVYAEVLGRAEVGPEDDFFALGGHSLLAMQLAARLRSVLPVHVSVATLVQAPTVAELLGTLAPSRQSAEILPIRAEGSRPPLFCLPPASGLSLCYTGLRSHLPADRPIYGLQSGPGASIDELATFYLDQIRAIQPTGPYHLLGWSFGGHVAHCLAVHLRKAGEEVSLLAVLDAYPHDPRLTDPRLSASAEDYTAAADLLAGHTWPDFDGDLLFFTAADERNGDSPTARDWRPYVGGGIENHDVAGGHFAMTEPGPLAAIGSVLAERLTGGTDHAH